MRKVSLFLAISMCLALTGCMDSGTEQGAGIGAVGGGVIGGVIGHQSGRTAEGAAIGIVSGAILGGLIGNQSDKSSSSPASGQQVIATCPNGHQVDVTGIPPGTDVRCPICNSVFQV